MAKKKISLALQGGGSHGAYTWGVIEHIIKSDLFDVRGICGTSAGAINGALTVYGMQKGGGEGALEALENFWQELSKLTLFTLPQPSWADNHIFKGNMNFSPGYLVFDFITKYFSPYQLNPLNINPLKELLEKHIDFKKIRNCECPLFVSATNVLKCDTRVFSLKDMTVEAILASACLPFLFQAVEIDGEHYWDGGYEGNPPMYPLIYETDCSDIVLIQINPIIIENVPKTASEIQDRMNEISFNSSLKAEMKMITHGYGTKGELRKVNFQMVKAIPLRGMGVSSKSNTSWEYLSYLRKLGNQSASDWIEENYETVGKDSSPFVKMMFY